MPLPRVLEPEVMSGADEAVEYDEMDFSATDQLFAQRAAELATRRRRHLDRRPRLRQRQNSAGDVPAPARATRVCAVEMSTEMLAVAARNRARDGVKLHLLAADAKHVPFADQSVGMITSNSLIHHIPDPRAVFQEIARIARPGAPILIRDLVRPETQQALDQLVEAHAAPVESPPAHSFRRLPTRRAHPRGSPRNARSMRTHRRKSHPNHRPPLERRTCLTP